MRVAILGATSHIAKNLIVENRVPRHWEISAFGRNVSQVQAFVNRNQCVVDIRPYLGFFEAADEFDAVINCVGFGTPEKVKVSGLSLFSVTEAVDNQILEYISKYPRVRYVNFSSGAVYGTALKRAVQPGQVAILEVSPLNPVDFYRLSKLHQEAKHRTCSELSIVDIRLFSFFSRFTDLDSSFFMNDVARSLLTGSTMKTTRTEMYRDFISPPDLYSLVNCILDSSATNRSVDTFSSAPVRKSELLTQLSREFGLAFEFVDREIVSPTGPKPFYYSEDRLPAESLGYFPKQSSWESIQAELLVLTQSYRGNV